MDKVLREVAGAKQGIAASYLRLWRAQHGTAASQSRRGQEGELGSGHRAEAVAERDDPRGAGEPSS